jgi:hypothetical protein
MEIPGPLFLAGAITYAIMRNRKRTPAEKVYDRRRNSQGISRRGQARKEGNRLNK